MYPIFRLRNGKMDFIAPLSANNDAHQTSVTAEPSCIKQSYPYRLGFGRNKVDVVHVQLNS